MISHISLGPPSRVGLTQIPGDHDILQGKFHNKFQYRFQDRQATPSISLKLRHIILNQILTPFSANKICNGPATWSILTSHYAWGPVTTYNGLPNTHGTAFGWESRVLTITRSWLLAHVWSGPYPNCLSIVDLKSCHYKSSGSLLTLCYSKGGNSSFENRCV